MKKSTFTNEQIAYALRQAEVGTPVAEICRKMGVTEQTFYRWKKKFAGMGVAELQRLRQLEEENKKLKQLVADLTLDKHMLQEGIRKSLYDEQKSGDARAKGRASPRKKQGRKAPREADQPGSEKRPPPRLFMDRTVSEASPGGMSLHAQAGSRQARARDALI